MSHSGSVRRHVPRLFIIIALLAGLVAMGTSVSNAAFPGTNGRLACSTSRDGGAFEVYSYHPDGSDPERLTFDPATDWDPVWSPDGSRIAFSSSRSGDEEIWDMKRDGSDLRQLTFTPGEDRPGSYTPDGTKIVFHSARFAGDIMPGPGESALEIMIMDADGSNPIRLTNNVFQDSFGHVSPDGTKIAFTTNRDADFEIYTMNLDGTSPTRVTNSPEEDAHASWSPDGSQLVFHSRRAPHGPDQLEIYRMNADGSGVATRLTNDSVAFDAFPVWSPDGTKIAWSRGVVGGFDTFTMDAVDGGNQVNISNTGSDLRCDWGPTAVAGPYYQACLYAGSLSQVTETADPLNPTLSCGRGTAIVLQGGEDYEACLYAGSLSQVGTTDPTCGRGVVIGLATGVDFHACLYAGSLSQVGTTKPSNCGRGTAIGLAGVLAF